MIFKLGSYCIMNPGDTRGGLSTLAGFSVCLSLDRFCQCDYITAVQDTVNKPYWCEVDKVGSNLTHECSCSTSRVNMLLRVTAGVIPSLDGLKPSLSLYELCSRGSNWKLLSKSISVVTDPSVTCRSEVPDAKKAKGDEEEEEYNLADIAEGSVISVRIRGER